MPGHKRRTQEPDDQLGFEIAIPVSSPNTHDNLPAPSPPGWVDENFEGIERVGEEDVHPEPSKSVPAPEPEPEPEPEVIVDQAPVVESFDITQTEGLFDAPRDPTIMAKSGLDEYKVPPFSILDTRMGDWQDRRRAWLRFDIQSEVGRDEKLTYGKFDQGHKEKIEEEWAKLSPEEKAARGREFAGAKFLKDHTREKYGAGSTSIFDPVLTEIMYHWFCPPGGIILDPFAGGSVRGIVAACLGHPYLGIELRGIQVDANRQQATDILRPGVMAHSVPRPLWVKGDSNVVLLDDSVPMVDFLFTCPPYADLEVYSDDPADLSKMSADEFDTTYASILSRSVARLHNDRFAVIVVSNIRDKTSGRIRDLEGLTCRAMEDAGAYFYNQGVLINVVGTAPIRAKKQFEKSRKTVRVHQAVLCFIKGDPRKAAALIEPQAN